MVFARRLVGLGRKARHMTSEGTELLLGCTPYSDPGPAKMALGGAGPRRLALPFEYALTAT
eukprot:365043-Chlamydomonas_euryale.AAC.13